MVPPLPTDSSMLTARAVVGIRRSRGAGPRLRAHSNANHAFNINSIMLRRMGVVAVVLTGDSAPEPTGPRLNPGIGRGRRVGPEFGAAGRRLECGLRRCQLPTKRAEFGGRHSAGTVPVGGLAYVSLKTTVRALPSRRRVPRARGDTRGRAGRVPWSRNGRASASASPTTSVTRPPPKLTLRQAGLRGYRLPATGYRLPATGSKVPGLGGRAGAASPDRTRPGQPPPHPAGDSAPTSPPPPALTPLSRPSGPRPAPAPHTDTQASRRARNGVGAG